MKICSIDQWNKIILEKELTFCVFDTAVLQYFPRHNDIYYLMDDFFRKLTGLNLVFHQLMAELDYSDFAEKYKALNRIGIDQSICKRIKSKEKQLLLKYFYPRKWFLNEYNSLLQSGHNIKFINNSKYSDDFVLEILKKCGFENVVLIQDTHLDAIFFEMSDFNKDRLQEFLRSASGNLINYKVVQGCIGYRWFERVIYSTLLDNPFERFSPNGIINAEPYKVGYVLLGMHFIGIIKWMFEHIKEMKSRRVLFCARDCYLLMQVYLRFKRIFPDLPPAKYIQASRKLLLSSFYRTKLDFYQLPDSYKFFSPHTVLRLFWPFNKFRHDGVPFSDFDDYFQEWASQRGLEYTSNFTEYLSYVKFIDMFLTEFYSETQHNNQLNILKEYYSDISDRDIIVDLGYTGRIQNQISVLSGYTLNVLYILRDEERLEEICQSGNIRVKSFYAGSCATSNVFREYLMSELVPSCVGIKKVGGQFEPVYETDPNQFDMGNGIVKLQKGAVDFVEDILEIMGDDVFRIPFISQEISLPWEGYIRNIPQYDIKMLKKFYQEDYHSGKKEEISWYERYPIEHKDLPEILIEREEKMKDMNISVVITTKNRKYEVARALKSVFSQSIEPLEVIIVDDSSSDGTKEYIESLNLGTYRYIYNLKTKGPGRSRNIGMIAANGNYIAYLDSDNEWYPNKLEAMFDVWKENKNADVYCSKYNRHAGFSAYESPADPIKADISIRDEILIHSIADASASIYRKSFLEKLGGFSEEYLSNIDWELLLRASRNQEIKFCKINQVLSENWLMFDSISSQVQEEVQERMIILSEYETDLIERNLQFDFYRQYCADHTEFTTENEKRNQFFKWMNYEPRWMDYVYDSIVDEKSNSFKSISILENEKSFLGKTVERKSNFYSLLSDWLDAKQNGISIADVLWEDGIRSVAIYGYGRHGKFAYNDLKNSQIKVQYIIDQNAEKVAKESQITVYGNVDLLPDIDAIIISPYMEYNTIVADLEEKISTKMLSLEKLIKKAKLIAKE